MRILAGLLALFVIVACSTPPAPVVDRSDVSARPTLDKTGKYRVRSGDTLFSIAFRYRLDHRELARWNRISSPYLIYPGQLLDLSGPVGGGAVSSAPRQARTEPAKPPAAKSPTVTSGRQQASAAAVPEKQRPSPVAADPSAWIWPVKGRVMRRFVAGDPARGGLDITGRKGQDVVATAPGNVVYSGNGLIGFGELIIIKHSERMLSAYAHNRVRLVQEGETVKGGQKIAEMGGDDRSEAILHFQIRVNGRPVNPELYLPPP